MKVMLLFVILFIASHSSDAQSSSCSLNGVNRVFSNVGQMMIEPLKETRKGLIDTLEQIARCLEYPETYVMKNEMRYNGRQEETDDAVIKCVKIVTTSARAGIRVMISPIESGRQAVTSMTQSVAHCSRAVSETLRNLGEIFLTELENHNDKLNQINNKLESIKL